MHAQSINTLSEFLLQAGTEYLVYDMGRGISLVDNQHFLEIETNQRTVARPRNGHAWYGLVFWNKQLNQEHYIWFIKLPIDEQSLLVSAARNQFLEIVVQALGQELERSKDPLPENPFVFSPAQQQLADFNAISRMALGNPNTANVKRVKQYIEAPQVQDWQQLSVQQMADYTAALYPPETVSADQHDMAVVDTLSAVLALLPAPVLTTLLSSLEHQPLCATLSNALIRLYDDAPSPEIKQLSVRAMSSCEDTHQRALFLQHVLASDTLDLETLVIVAGRYWSILDEASLKQYMHKVAQADQSFQLFAGIYSDLVQVPQMRAGLLAFIRDPERAEVVSLAIADLFARAGR